MRPADDATAPAAIVDLVGRYCDAVAAADAARFRACWADGARWTGPGLDKTGVDAIVRAWATMRGRYASAVQTIEGGTVDLHGTTARGSWSVREQLVALDGSTRETVGRYDDEYVYGEIDGVEAWRFARRAFTPAPAAT